MSTADQVNTFLLAFEKLRLCSDGDPGSLLEDVMTDDSVGELCTELMTLHGNLLGGLPSIRPGLKDGLVSQHVARLREYSDRWERNVDLAAFAWIRKRNQELREQGDLDETLHDLLNRGDEIAEGLSDMSIGLRDDIWTYLDTLGKDIQRGIADELEFTDALSEDGNYQTAVGRFFWTLGQQGWDVDGIIRRSGLIPDIMVPSHVASRLHNQERPVLYEHLFQASQAYIVGSYAAAIGLLRALLEHVLREHYGASGNDLHQIVQSARGLPPIVKRGEMHGLRMAANAILHPGAGKIPDEQKHDRKRSEIEIAQHLRLVRDLIEGAPRQPVRPG